MFKDRAAVYQVITSLTSSPKVYNSLLKAVQALYLYLPSAKRQNDAKLCVPDICTDLSNSDALISFYFFKIPYLVKYMF